MDLHLPSASASPFPVVLSIHGGGWLLGSNKIETSDSLGVATLWQQLLDHGIAVASVQYRLSGEAPFPAQLHDVKAAVRWLRAFGAHYGIDPTRVASFGDSAGAHLTALLAANIGSDELEGAVGVREGGSHISAAVAWYPPTDFTSLTSSAHDYRSDDSMTSLLIGANTRSHEDLARAASPVAYVNAGSAPILLQHGQVDDLVPYQQSELLAERYREVGAQAQVQIVAGAGHGFEEPQVGEVVALAVDFLTRNLTGPRVLDAGAEPITG